MHMVAIVCLTLALIAALGWVFYLNFVAKQTVKENEHGTTSSVSTPKTHVALKEYQLANDKLKFSAPSDWSVDMQSLEAGDFLPARDKTTIKNASGKVMLNIATGISGLGGACDSDTNQSITVVESAKTKVVSKVTDQDASVRSREVYAVRAYYHDPAKGYAPFLFLSDQTSVHKNGAVVTTCLPGLTALYMGTNVQGAIAVASPGGVIEDNPKNNPMLFEQSKEQALATLNSSDSNKTYSLLKTASY